MWLRPAVAWVRSQIETDPAFLTGAAGPVRIPDSPAPRQSGGKYARGGALTRAAALAPGLLARAPTRITEVSRNSFCSLRSSSMSACTLKIVLGCVLPFREGLSAQVVGDCPEDRAGSGVGQ